MTKQDKMKINNLLVRIKQIEDEIERLRLFDNQIEADYNRVFDYGVTNRIMLDEQCRKIGELKAKFEAKSCDFVKTAQTHAVQDFAEELKAKTMCIKEYEDGTRILQTSNKLIDQSVKIFLDELLKECKNDKTRND